MISRCLSCWVDGGVEEIDLELDVLRSASGEITVRDQDKFQQLRDEYGSADRDRASAEDTCRTICGMIERREEPFGSIGPAWLEQFLKAVHRHAVKSHTRTFYAGLIYRLIGLC